MTQITAPCGATHNVQGVAFSGDLRPHECGELHKRECPDDYPAEWCYHHLPPSQPAPEPVEWSVEEVSTFTTRVEIAGFSFDVDHSKVSPFDLRTALARLAGSANEFPGRVRKGDRLSDEQRDWLAGYKAGHGEGYDAGYKAGSATDDPYPPNTDERGLPFDRWTQREEALPKLEDDKVYPALDGGEKLILMSGAAMRRYGKGWLITHVAAPLPPPPAPRRRPEDTPGVPVKIGEADTDNPPSGGFYHFVEKTDYGWDFDPLAHDATHVVYIAWPEGSDD